MAEHFRKSLKIEEAKVDLPVEILIDIVLRLPIKSILTWTSVSKSWNSLIKNPKFISTHLNNHNQKPQLLFLRKLGKSIWDYTSKGEKEVYSLNWDSEPFDEYTRFDFPFRVPRLSEVFHIVGTCNGLVCLANSRNFFVWNPCIRKYVTIPTLFWYYAGSGFGFDSKTNDYKVVRIEDGLKKIEHKVNVYSLATGEWKMVIAVPRRFFFSESEPRQAFVNGALHWAAKRKTNDGLQDFILAFDLGDENVREIMLPKDLLTCNSLSSLCVSIFGESLAVYRRLYTDTDSCTDIWVMKEYGVLESWTKVLTVDSQGGRFTRIAPKVVGFRNTGEVVLEKEIEKVVSLDPKHKKMKDLSLKVPYEHTFVDPYMESLVLLDNSTVSYKGKRRTEMSNTAPKKRRVKADWTVKNTELFIDICIDEVKAGNRPSSHFNTVGWTNIVEKFTAAVHSPYTHKMLKNKWDWLKKDFVFWMKLIGKETGLGWDPEKNTIAASDEWWDKKLQEVPEASKFRHRGLDNVPKLEFLFRGVTATGESAWAPSSGQLPGEVVDSEEIMEGSGESTNEPANPGPVPTPSLTHTLIQPTQDKGKKRTSARIAAGKGKKQEGTAAILSRQIERMCDAIDSRTSAISRLQVTLEGKNSIDDCVAMLDSMPEIEDGSSLYLNAIELFRQKEYRDLFMAIKRNDIRVAWLNKFHNA